MAFDSTSGGTGYSRNMNVSQKRELLWNIVEPGDPYDIKKSLIAKLPGERRVYMGDCLEIVCLFQAAEIERLIENLDEYRLKYKEIEKRELDRHSYEIQIKELAQQLSETEGLRVEILKLREFIRKQSVELEEEKKRNAGIDVNLQHKYNSSLAQIESMFQELNQVKAQLHSWRSRYEALDRTRLKELEELRSSMDVQRKSQLDKEVRDLTVRFNLERSQFEIELRRLKEALEARSHESEEWRNKLKICQAQLQEANSKFGHNQQLERRIGEYEIRMSGLTQNLEQLDRQLKDKTNELIQLSGQYRQFQAEYSRRQTEVRQYAQRITTYEQEIEKRNRALAEFQAKFVQISEQNSRLTEYEDKIALLSQEIERLNVVLKNNLHEKNDIAARYNKLEFELESLRSAANRQTAQLDEAYQSKLSAMTQEIERREREKREFQLRYTRIETEFGQQRIQLTQYASEIERLTREWNLANSKLSDVERLGRLNGELQAQATRLANEKRVVEEEFAKHQREWNTNLQRTGSEVNEYRRQVSVFTEENNLLKKRLQELGDLPRKISEYEAKIALMAKEHERISELIRQHEGESQSKLTIYVKREEEYVRRIQQLEGNFRQLQAQYDKVQLQVEHLGRENSSLVQRTNEIDRLNKSTIDLQGSLVKLTREKQEIVEESRNAQETLRQTNLNLQRLMGEHSDVRQKYNLLHQENEQLKNSLATASSEIGRRLGDSENRVLQLSSENDNLKRRLNDANNEWNSKQNGYEQRIASYEQRIAGYDQRIVTYESKISSYEQRITIITRQSDNLKRQTQQSGDLLRKLAEYEDKFGMLSMEIERLNEKLRQKSAEAIDWEGRFKQTAAERDQLDAIAHNLQQQLKEATDSSRKLQEYQNEIRQLGQEVETMSKNLRSKVEELSRQQLIINEMTNFRDKYHQLERELESRNRQFEEQIRRIENDFNAKARGNEAMLANLRKQNEDLRKKAVDSTETNRRITEYENKLALLGQEVERLNEKLRGKIEQLASWEAKCKQIARQRDELDVIAHDLQNRVQTTDEQFSRFEGIINERDSTIAGLNRRLAEIDGMNREVSGLQDRLNQLLSQNKRLKDDLRAAEDGIRSANNKAAALAQERDALARRNSDLQNSVASLSMEVERLNKILRAKVEQAETLAARLRDAQAQNKSTVELQSRISVLIREKEMLVLESQKNNEGLRVSLSSLKSQNDNLKQNIAELRGYQDKLNAAVRENEQLRRNVRELNEMLKKVNEQEAKVIRLSQENEKLGNMLEQKNREYQQLSQRLADVDQQNRTIKELQDRLAKLTSENVQLTSEITTIQQTSSIQVSRIGQETNELRSKLNSSLQESDDLRRRLAEVDHLNNKMSDYETRLAMLTKEIERLNSVLKTKVEESNTLQNAVREMSQKNRTLQIQLETVSVSVQDKYEERISLLDKQILRLNDVLRRKVQDLGTWEQRYTQLYAEREELMKISHDLQRKVQEFNDVDQAKLGEYQITISKLGKEIERLNAVIQRLSSQNGELRTRSIQINEEYTSLRTQYEQINIRHEEDVRGRLGSLSKENDQLRLELNDSNNARLQYENRIALMSQEIERLNSVLRGKLQELKEAELKLQRFGGESTETKQRLAILSAENEELKGRLVEWSQKLEIEVKTRSSTFQQRLVSVTRELEEYRRRLAESENNNAALRQQIDRLNISLKQKLDLENRSAHLVQEIERLNNVLRIKVQESQEWEQKYTDLYSRYREIESRTGSFTLQYQKLQNLYAQAMRENEQYKRRSQEFEMKFTKLNAQFERLNAIITELKQQNFRLKSELSKHDYQALEEMNRHLSAEIERLNKIIKQLEQDVSELRIRLSDEISLHKRIQEHLALFVVLFAEIESLRKRVKDKEREVEDVRRSSLAPFKIS